MPHDIVSGREARDDLKRLRNDDEDLTDWLFEHDPKAIQAAEAARERANSLRFGVSTGLAARRSRLS